MTSIPQRLPTAAGDRSTLALSALLNTVLGCRLTFGTRLDENVLRRATRLVLDAEPHLGCHLRESLTTAEWERCETLDARVPFAVVETTNPHDDAVAFHDEPFGETGPRVAVRLLRSGDADDVCIRLDHIAGDGWSTKMLAYLLAQTYTRVLADPDFVPEPNLSADANARLEPALRTVLVDLFGASPSDVLVQRESAILPEPSGKYRLTRRFASLPFASLFPVRGVAA